MRTERQGKCSLQTQRGGREQGGSRSSYMKAQYWHKSKWDWLPGKLLRLGVIKGWSPPSYRLPSSCCSLLVERGRLLEGAVRCFALPKLSLAVS